MMQQYTGPFTMMCMLKVFINMFTFAMTEYGETPTASSFPKWFRDLHPDMPIITGEQSGWPALSLFYHVTPREKVPLILKYGLRVPTHVDETEHVGLLGEEGTEREPMRGIYLEEDMELVLYLAGEMYEKQTTYRPLSLLDVYVRPDMHWVYDPEGPPGSIIVLNDIPRELVAVNRYMITGDMIPGEPP